MKQSNSRNSAFQLTASQGGWPHLAGWPLSVPYFNSQPHKEADKDVIVPSRPIWYFNSQPHKEADWWPGKRVMWWRWFQLTASQGGWPQMRVIVQLAGVFQLTASQGGWQFSSILPAHSRNFNSQPHKEADNQQTGKLSHVHISTHSLTRRLTDLHIHQSNSGTISTHSLTRRLTVSPYSAFFVTEISTHSLTRRLTPVLGFCTLLHHFNSQPHKEADLPPAPWYDGLSIFQLTASQGGWLSWSQDQDIVHIISTHSLTRRLTHGSSSSSSSSYISTHSLTRRLTETEVIEAVYGTISTHSLTRRLTESGRTDDTIMHISTHSLTRRLTHDTCCTTLQTRYFNSQPHKEADEFLVSDTIAHFIFQLTASQGGWRQMLCCNPEYSNISTHSLTRRLTTNRRYLWKIWSISTHSLTRRLTERRYFDAQTAGFQLTASQGGWLLCSRSQGSASIISTHSLTRRLTGLYMECCGHHRHFNSQPHKEADTTEQAQQIEQNISTHSLTRRLTGYWYAREKGKWISTHSLTRRLTP